MSSPVRTARPEELAALPAIESTGDRMFAAIGFVFPPGPSTVGTAIRNGAEVLVTGDPPVGFAALVTVDGHPHLEQISVRGDQGRQGTGTLLLRAAVRQAGAGLTLITYRDVPWNGPWYARHGFEEFPEAAWGPELRAHWQSEIDAGIHALGPRLVMRQRGPDQSTGRTG